MIFTKYTLYRILLCLAFGALTIENQVRAAITDTMPNGTQNSPYTLAPEFDRLIAAESRNNEPGGEILVAQKGQIIEFLRDSTGSIHQLALGKAGIANYYWFKTSQPIPALLPTRVPDSLMQQYAGRYVFSAGDTLTIIKEGSGIVAQPTGKEKFPTYAEKEHIFLSIKERARFEFRRDRSGLINKLIWYQDKEKKEAKRLR
ncbi:DUF3471 domain-containing protein [Pseudoflavitalea sp. X16]|uniref:DUF3471 domain-containing protein n=1 Tax=Paraflavitalea devenefica TaxID=2716334 RepID=UPI00141F0EDA|nr:DUF3471 domain-containing protein [Paraflavitalea devenefica]NII24716.1 DUF3471 domain-containing protein [Paraflavitalea devenefica]